jgi:hypothetical protein
MPFSADAVRGINTGEQSRPIHRCISAYEFLTYYEPHVLEVMLDPLTALIEDSKKAVEIADSLGVPGDIQYIEALGPGGTALRTFPTYIWEIVYS